MREVFRFVYTSDFEEERGDPVKEGLASFEGVLLHCAIDIADHCLGLSIAAFPERLLQGEVWLIPIPKSHLPLLGFNPLYPKSRESVLGRGFIEVSSVLLSRCAAGEKSATCTGGMFIFLLV